MDEKEKNSRLRWSKDLPPDAQAARRRYMDILKADDSVPELKDPIALIDAAARLGCARNELLDEGSKGERVIYAPVLDAGLYAWPVTEYGIPFTSLVGNLDGVGPIFQARLSYGEYGALHPDDIKKLKIEQSIRPQGYIFPERVLQRLSEWAAAQQDEEATSLVKRMEALATTVAWVPAFPAGNESGTIKPEMLRVDGCDVQFLADQPEEQDNTGVAHGESALGPEITAMADATTPNQQQYGEKRRKQIEAIEAGARALNLDPQKISVGKPKEEKKKIRKWCKGAHLELFGGGNDPFDEAWDVAAKTGKIVVINKRKFTAR